MNVDVFTKNTRVKINDGLYNDLIENVVYTTDNITRIRSIKTETDVSPILYNLKDFQIFHL